MVPLASGQGGPLGCGTHTAYIYDRGGEVRMGQLTTTTYVRWRRVRDDISTAVVRLVPLDPACCDMLADVRSGRHELVIYRSTEDGQNARVWEGPITRVAYQRTEIEIEARDVSHYLYRRIFRDGYDASYPDIQFVLDVAEQIIENAFGVGPDLNVLPYLTVYRNDGDPRTSKEIHDYQKTAWEEVDALAQHSGMDYTTIGRRIILIDTHRSPGGIPAIADGDIFGDPVVTEYGMELATRAAVTNGEGIWGAAGGTDEYYGLWEKLVTSQNEDSEAGQDPDPDVLAEQAERHVTVPAPVRVRIPSGSTLNPAYVAGINDLVPMVRVLLRSELTCRKIAQTQKLDKVEVVEDSGNEEIKITLIPVSANDADSGAPTVRERIDA